MSYAIFYNYELFGDVIIIKFANKPATKVEQRNNITVIYNDEDIIGYNIFKTKHIVKIKAKGLIPLPADSLIDLINALLTNENLNPLPYKLQSGFVVGYVKEAVKHPDSDHLSLTKVDIGEEELLPIVCGASNVEAGQKVVVAKVNTFMFDGTLIGEGKVLGETSKGMICSAYELNFISGQDDSGILILDDDAIIGSDIFALERRY